MNLGRLLGGRLACRFRLPGRYADRDYGAHAFPRADLQRAAVKLRQRARDREAEARAGVVLGELVTFYTKVLRTGTTSVTVDVEVEVERLGPSGNREILDRRV